MFKSISYIEYLHFKEELENFCNSLSPLAKVLLNDNTVFIKIKNVPDMVNTTPDCKVETFRIEIKSPLSCVCEYMVGSVKFAFDEEGTEYCSVDTCVYINIIDALKHSKDNIMLAEYSDIRKLCETKSITEMFDTVREISYCASQSVNKPSEKGDRAKLRVLRDINEICNVVDELSQEN